MKKTNKKQAEKPLKKPLKTSQKQVKNPLKKWTII